MDNFLANNKCQVIEAAATAGVSTLDSDVLDMAGWEGVTFLALLGDVTAGSVLTLIAQHGDLENGSDMVDTEVSATFTAGASDADHKLLAIEAFRPTKKYMRARLTRAEENAVVGGIVAILSGPNRAPVSQDATVIASSFGSPVLSA